MASDETVAALLTLLKQPKSSQQLRDAMNCSPVVTDEALYELRDDGQIAFANGEWYKIRGGRFSRAKRPKKQDQRQGNLFDEQED